MNTGPKCVWWEMTGPPPYRVMSVWQASAFCDPPQPVDDDRDRPTREVVVAGRVYRRLDLAQC